MTDKLPNMVAQVTKRGRGAPRRTPVGSRRIQIAVDPTLQEKIARHRDRLQRDRGDIEATVITEQAAILDLARRGADRCDG